MIVYRRWFYILDQQFPARSGWNLLVKPKRNSDESEKLVSPSLFVSGSGGELQFEGPWSVMMITVQSSPCAWSNEKWSHRVWSSDQILNHLNSSDSTGPRWVWTCGHRPDWAGDCCVRVVQASKVSVYACSALGERLGIFISNRFGHLDSPCTVPKSSSARGIKQSFLYLGDESHNISRNVNNSPGNPRQR